MGKTKPTTVTIGIPAHNEEANITNVLKSVLRQKGSNFIIEKIFVLCDGCTDTTAEKTRKFTTEYPIINVIDDGKRKGKMGRLNQIYRINKSDLVFSVDADVVLRGENVIKKMVSAFSKEDVVLVSGNNQPLKAGTLFERFYNTGFEMWYQIRKDCNNGNHIGNIHAMIVGLRDSFAKSFKYPEETYISDGGFAFISAKLKKKEFRFVEDSIVIFRSVDNLQDYFLQATRNLNAKKSIADHFGDWVYKEYYIPRKKKVKGILKALISNPLYTTGALLLMLTLRFNNQKRFWLEGCGKWKISKSTKRAISI